MATAELLPNLHLLTPGGWQVYVWRDEDGSPSSTPAQPARVQVSVQAWRSSV